MNRTNKKSLREVDAGWQLTRRAVGSLTSSPAAGSHPRGAVANTIDHWLSSSLSNIPATIQHFVESLGVHEIVQRPSGLEGFAIIRQAATGDDFNIIGPLDDCNSAPEDNHCLTVAEPSAISSLDSFPDRPAGPPDSFQDTLPPAATEPVPFNSEANPVANLSSVPRPQPAAATTAQQQLGAAITPNVGGLTQTLPATGSSAALGTILPDSNSPASSAFPFPPDLSSAISAVTSPRSEVERQQQPVSSSTPENTAETLPTTYAAQQSPGEEMPSEVANQVTQDLSKTVSPGPLGTILPGSKDLGERRSAKWISIFKDYE